LISGGGPEGVKATKLSTDKYFLFSFFLSLSAAVGKSLVQHLLETDEVSSDEN
jgi:hypothetical protein